jgi:Ca-activated chloride channel family protein
MIFANPLYFLLLLLLIPMIGWYIWKQRSMKASLRLSSSAGFEKAPRSIRMYLRHLPFAFRMIAFALLVVALARPQTTDSWNTSTTEGIDIILSLDISTSMLAEDLRPNRIEAAKDVAASFINGRPTDNIGLVIFAGESFTQCPLTTDHTVLLNLLKDVQCHIIEDGTAIGHGLATSITRLKDSQAISKVIILLTDGTNNRGEVAPVTAAEIARTYGIRVYTVGVGSKGEAPYPFQSPTGGVHYQNIPVEIDENVLTQIAQNTGGLYFRATNNKALKEIYAEIDQMEKTKMSVQEYSKKQEEYARFAMIALLFFLIELLLRYTILKNIP